MRSTVVVIVGLSLSTLPSLAQIHAPYGASGISLHSDIYSGYSLYSLFKQANKDKYNVKDIDGVDYYKDDSIISHGGLSISPTDESLVTLAFIQILNHQSISMATLACLTEHTTRLKR